MLPISLHDRQQIEAFLRRQVDLHLYDLGDLDDFFWPYTVWYGRLQNAELSQLCLLYTGVPGGVLLALCPDEPEPMQEMHALLTSLLPFLPVSSYAHLSPGLEKALQPAYHLHSHGKHQKMSLRNPAALSAIDTRRTERLAPADLPELQAFYAASYPDNAFDPRMLETGHYYAVRLQSRLAAVAGIHAYSPRYRVAAVGNVTTHPAHRSQGLGTLVTARLCQELLPHIDHIGLNVKSDNVPAIACYTRLGFEYVADYEEFDLQARPGES